MRYRTFELLAGAFGMTAILATVIMGITSPSSTTWQEMVAQLMFLPVLFGALHYGRNGGFLSALFAVAVYVGINVPNAAASPGSGTLLLELVGIRGLAYVLVGVVGGEMCSRIKYFFLSVEASDLIDNETGIYGPLHVGRLLASLIEQHRRYGTCFSAATMTLDPEVLARIGMTGRSGKSVMHDLAAAVRSDVRAVDEVGRMSADALLVLFPNTPPSGGNVAVERLTRTAQAMLSRRGAPEGADILAVGVLGYPDHPEGVVALVEQLTGEPFVLPESGAAVASSS